MPPRYQFDGGIVLPGHKLYGEAGRTQIATIPPELILPLEQHIGAPARPVVQVGQRVLRGEVIAVADAPVSAALHASTSGEVVAIEERAAPHPSQLPMRCIVLRSDGKDESVAHLKRTDSGETPGPTVDLQSLIEICRQAGIVGLGGAAFPAEAKLAAAQSHPVHTVILNGAECEPYISCDGAAMLEDAVKILRGAKLLQEALGATQVIVAIEDENREALEEMRETQRQLAIANLTIETVPTRYPQGGEKQLIQTLTGEEIPSGGHPPDIGIVVHNVATVGAIWDAVTQALPLTERIVTVTGPGLQQPTNLRVRIGTPVRHLIDICGGYTHQGEHQLIMGGPMMGYALHDDLVPVVKATNCILVDADVRSPVTAPSMPCIRCGDCVDVCPSRLLPQQLYWHARAGELDKAAALNLADCIECGCCDEVCPSGIALVSHYRYAKSQLRQQAREKQRAEVARSRHDFRAERLEREKRAKEEARRRKREELARKQAAAKAAAENAQKNESEGSTPQTVSTNPSPAVQAAIERARQQKAAKAQDLAADKTENPT